MHIWGSKPRVLFWSYLVSYLLDIQRGVTQQDFKFRRLKLSGDGRTRNVKLGVGH